MRFSPARVGGRPVRQLLQQPFTFALSERVETAKPQVITPKR